MASALAQRLKEALYRNQVHPYQHFEREVKRCLSSRPGTLLDIGCGREAPVLKKFKDQADRLVGLELVPYRTSSAELTLLHGSMSSIPLPDESVDVAMARSVIEHVEDPIAGFREVSRVLRPGGAFVFLTANLWDYASLMALAIPNRFHPWLVSKLEGRPPEDTFPTRYRCNTGRSVGRAADAAGLKVETFTHLSQYPNYFMFNGAAFLLASAYEKVISRTSWLAPLRGWILATTRKP